MTELRLPGGCHCPIPTPCAGPDSEFVTAAARRLGASAAIFAVALVVGVALSYLMPAVTGVAPEAERLRNSVLLALLAAACAALAITVRSGRCACPRILGMGLALELAGALVLAVGQYLRLLQPGEQVAQPPSWNGFWVALFPLLVPVPWRLRLLITGLASSAPALVVLVGQPLLGGELRVGLLLEAAIPNWFCGGIGLAVSRVVHDWALRLSRARQEVQDLGSYRLIERIGEGGMGEVWRAEHRMLARPVALKLIRPPRTVAEAEEAVPDAMVRFEREARATASLSSPHTVTVYDFGVQPDGRFFYAMELLEGIDLETLVDRHGPQPPARVVHILVQVCRSLAEAHDAGLIHRDIKPANIFLCRIGGRHDFVKVLDFGLVLHRPDLHPKTADRVTRDGYVTGTPGYLAPEVATGDGSVDHRSDLYSLGCVAYRLLSGREVFDPRGRTAMQVLLAHIQETPQPLIEVAPSVPPALAEVVMRCLAKHPEDRPGNARVLEGRLLKAQPDEWTEHQAKEWWASQSTAAAERNESPTLVP